MKKIKIKVICKDKEFRKPIVKNTFDSQRVALYAAEYGLVKQNKVRSFSLGVMIKPENIDKLYTYFKLENIHTCLYLDVDEKHIDYNKEYELKVKISNYSDSDIWIDFSTRIATFSSHIEELNEIVIEDYEIKD